jgi:rubrerythrin
MGLQVDFSRLDARDFLDIAIEVEREAMEHYQQLEAWMRASAEPDVLQFFRAMAGREDRHREQLTAKRHELFGDDPPRHDVASVPWEVEAPDLDRVGATLDLRSALEMALGMETRAHDYYAEAKEYAQDDAVSEILESFRLAEAEHQRLVKEQLDRVIAGG